MKFQSNFPNCHLSFLIFSQVLTYSSFATSVDTLSFRFSFKLLKFEVGTVVHVTTQYFPIQCLTICMSVRHCQCAVLLLLFLLGMLVCCTSAGALWVSCRVVILNHCSLMFHPLMQYIPVLETIQFFPSGRCAQLNTIQSKKTKHKNADGKCKGSKSKDAMLLFLHLPKVQHCEETISQRFILLDYWSKLIFKAIFF